VPNLMAAEPFISVPIAVTPIVHGNVLEEPVVDSRVNMVATPIVDSPVPEINEEEVPIFQEPIVNQEEEQQQPPI
jgi:hypothetical protein